MTISSSISKAAHLTNAAVTDYAYPFKIFAASQVSVTVVDKTTRAETTLALTTDYTVAGMGADTGGKVSLTAAGKTKAGTGHRLIVLRNMGFVQEVDYQPHDIFPAETHERALDILTMQDQELREMLGRAIVAPIGGEPVTWEDMLELRDEAQDAAVTSAAEAATARVQASAAANSAAEAAKARVQAQAAAVTAEVKAVIATGAADDARNSATEAKGYADRAEEILDGAAVDAQLWIAAINAVRITASGLKRSVEIYKLGGY